ncbi:MAG: glycosyltransferase family 39 protein [Rikenellaceae bacterium]
MFRYLKDKPNCLLLVLLLLWSLLNVFTASLSEIIADEAYYWVLSRELDWGYFDHPPLVAFFLRMGTALFGDIEIGVRFFTITLHFATLWLFWKVVRPVTASYRTVLRYFLICFSLPLLHVYGFVATPDAPLLFSIAFTLWAYKAFVESDSKDTMSQLLSIVYLAIGFTLMAYSKYHGALIVMALVLSRPRLLTSWRFYATSLLTIVLYLPHLNWQFTHDFVSLEYHLSARNDPFAWHYVSEYLLNFFGAYNPFLTIPFIAIIAQGLKKSSDPMRRYYWISSVFILCFFLYSTLRGHVQAQWMLPVVFPIIYFLLEKSENSKRFSKYLCISSASFGGIMLVVHIVVMVAVKPILPNIGLSGVAQATARAGLTLRGASDLDDKQKSAVAFIMDGEYDYASLFNFYSDMPSYGSPSIYDRSSQYQFINFTDSLYGKCVAVEVSMARRVNVSQLELQSKYSSVTVPTMGTRYYQLCQNYIPTERVVVSTESIPEKVLVNQNLALKLNIENPYPFNITLNNSDSISLKVHLRGKDGFFMDLDMPITKEYLLKAGAKITTPTSLSIPEVETGDYKLSFTLQRAPYGSWHNSKVFDVMIVNPKTRRI